MNYDLTYLSLGAGVQSSVLYCMAVMKQLHFDFAVFSDVGNDSAATYAYLEYLKSLNGPQIIAVSRGESISEGYKRSLKQGKRFATVPMFTRGADGRAAPGRRQCTREYKIEPIIKGIRKELGYKPRQRVKAKVRGAVGFSTDEMRRMSASRINWIDNWYPLIDQRMNRHECKIWLQKNGFLVPEKSACVFCPYRTGAEWRNMTDRDFCEACDFDEMARDQTKSGLKNAAYVLRSLTPLAELDRSTPQQELFTLGGLL